MICTVGDSKWVRSRLGFFQGDEVSEHQSSSPVLGRWVWLSQILIGETWHDHFWAGSLLHIFQCSYDSFVQFWEEVQLYVTVCSNLIFHPSLLLTHTYTHMLYRKQKNIYLQRRWLKWCSNTQTKWENCSRNTSNHHLFTLICSLVVVMATWEKGRRVKQHAWKKYSYNGNILL